LQTENDISKLESYISKAIDELSLRYATTEDLKIIKATVNKSLHGDKINEIFKQYKNLESEHNFEFLCLADSSDRVMINGRIDLVINDKEKGITIVDFKTSSIDPDARLETLQLPIYTKGYSEVNPQIPSEGFILNVDTNVQSKTKKLSLDEYNKIVPVIAESIKYIKEDSFPCTAGDKCEKCKFKTICHCYFKK
jgi:CRISPR/Cas system-associated exonuclease Cas4 (RecB family)